LRLGGIRSAAADWNPISFDTLPPERYWMLVLGRLELFISHLWLIPRLFPGSFPNLWGIQPRLTVPAQKSIVSASVGGHSSMVESKLVELVVAGSNPVGHPTFPRQKPGKKTAGCFHPAV
jgi:hypothetical protein